VERTLTAPTPGAWMPPGGAEFSTALAIPPTTTTDLRLRVWTDEHGRVANRIEVPLR
jgi:hypothetical protein